jgi:hypothetical protein
MVAEHGGFEAARQLLRGRDASDGFTALCEAPRLEMSVEAAALLPWYEALFTDEERAVPTQENPPAREGSDLQLQMVAGAGFEPTTFGL